MSILKSVNRLRRSWMRALTRRLGVTRVKTNGTEVSIRKILVVRPNHRLGNLLLITPLLQELRDTLPEAKVDLFVKGNVAPQLFKEYDNIERIIRFPKKPLKDIVTYIQGWLAIRTNRYDLVINAIHSSSSGKVSAQFANARFRFLGEINEHIRLRYSDHLHMAKIPVYSFRYFINKLGFQTTEAPVPPLDLRLTKSEVDEGRQLLRKLVNVKKRTIGIYTYATGQKCYQTFWWNELYSQLKEKFSGYNILEILPIENVSQISFKAPSFYSKNLREIASLISNLTVFIAADSGMMHLASAAGATVVGLFKTDNIIQYAPYNDRSIGLHTDRISQREIVNIIETLTTAVDSEIRSEKWR